MDILLIEDNLELANLMQAFLKKEGFSLWHETSSEEALAWLADHQVKLILLDIMLPGMDGFAFCKSIRKAYDIPILIISAKSTKEDQLIGFQLGADDYIPKPVDTDILSAKIHALFARTYGRAQQMMITSGSLSIDIDARKVFLHEQELDLNVKEYELLLCFVKHANKTLSKEYLFHQIWGMESESEEQTLTVHIKMLRKKIEEDPKCPQRIITVWGIGYRYEEL